MNRKQRRNVAPKSAYAIITLKNLPDVPYRMTGARTVSQTFVAPDDFLLWSSVVSGMFKLLDIQGTDLRIGYLIRYINHLPSAVREALAWGIISGADFELTEEVKTEDDKEVHMLEATFTKQVHPKLQAKEGKKPLWTPGDPL